MRYLIIGGSIAGINAVEAIRQRDQSGEIIVISEEKDPPYSRPLISYWLANEITDQEMLYRPLDFFEQNNVNLILGKKAARVDLKTKIVELKSGEVLKYDKLLFACGGKKIIPPGLEDVPYHTFYTWDDVRKISARVRRKGPHQHALVVGGGLVGLKAAESLRALGVEVTVVDLAANLLSSILPGSVGQFLEKLLARDEGLHFYLQTTVSQVQTCGDKIACEIAGLPMVFDHMILAIGVRPNLELCANSGIAINKGILVDKQMQTNLPHHFAAGDLVEIAEPVSGEKKVAAILPNAAYQGRIAGAVMAGADVCLDSHTVFNSLNIFQHSLVTIGLTTGELKVETKFDEQDSCSRFFYKGDRLCGVTLINQPERSGVYRYLIENHINLGKSEFTKPNLLKLPEKTWLELGLC